ncbi:MAG: GntR family transcriptional regulator [Clostridiales bacterium]|nr:GntR family transcriptional regulator [Clostridiales bacterium]
MPKNALTLDMKIAKEIEYRIDSGTYGEGDRLPSERALAEEFRVQRGTVRKALRFLAVRGRIVARKGSGYYISPRRITFDLNAFSSRKKIMEKTGKSTFVKLLTMEVIRVPEKMLRKTLWPEGTMAHKIMRLRYAAGQPEGLERAHIRCDIVPELSEEDVHNKSIYSFLKKEYGIEIARSLSTVSVVYTNGLESELLNTKFSKPVLRYEGIVFDRKNRPIEYFDDIILKDRVQFVKNDV